MKTTALALAAAAAFASLSGCTTTYTPQPGEPLARLRVVTVQPPQYATDVTWASFVDVVDISTCPKPVTTLVKTGVLSATNVQRLGMPGLPTGGGLVTEFAVPAGRPLALLFFMGAGRWSCQVQMAWTPRVGADYEAQYHLSADKNRCVIPLRELKPTRTGVQRVEAAGVRKWNSSQPCGVEPSGAK